MYWKQNYCMKHSHHIFKYMGTDEHAPVTFQLMHYCIATPLQSAGSPLRPKLVERRRDMWKTDGHTIHFL